MNLQSYIKQLRKYGKRAFTIEEILEEFKVSRNYARVALYRLIQSGDLISPAKAFYVIVPPEYQTYGSIPAEQLIPILMKHLNIDYYVIFTFLPPYYFSKSLSAGVHPHPRCTLF